MEGATTAPTAPPSTIGTPGGSDRIEHPGEVCVPLDHTAAHRSTSADLLVSGIEQVDTTTWTVDLNLPRSHWLCHPTPGTIPLLLFVEAFRQAGITVCTAGMHTAPSIHFVISKLGIRTAGPIPFPRFGAARYTATVSFAAITHRKGAPDRLEVDFTIADTASAHFSARAIRDVDYRVIRRGTAPLGDQIIERSSTTLRDLARAADGTATALLGVNEADPFFFDHPVDHIPGTLLVHAATTLHGLEVGTDATAVDVMFPGFAELRTPTRLRTRADGASAHTVITQGERTVALIETGTAATSAAAHGTAAPGTAAPGTAAPGATTATAGGAGDL